MTLSVWRLLLFSLALAAARSVIAENSTGIYQWTDDKGRIHFGDRPVNRSGELRELPPLPANAPSSEGMDRRAAQQRLLQVLSLERAQKKEAKERQQSEWLAHQRRCKTLGETLSQLEDGHVVYYRENEAGGRDFISDHERSLQAEQVRDKWERECS